MLPHICNCNQFCRTKGLLLSGDAAMKLYFSPGACSLSPHIVLNEAGLPFDRVKTDTKTKITETGADFKQVNPLGYVPVLELDDGTKLTEGPAIVQYIADKVPGKKLAPP